MKRLSNKRLFFAAAISLIAHALFFLVMPHFFPETKKNQMATLQLWMKEKQKNPKTSKTNDDKKPVVTIFERENSIRPDKANYFAEHDQTIQKETKSLKQNSRPEKVNETAMPKENLTEQNDEAAPKTKDQDQQKQKPIDNEVGYKKLRPPSTSAHSKEDPLGIKLKFNRPRLNESQAKGFDDYLPNVDEEQKTNLNTWQWRHAPFFNRIKTRISQTWSPQNQISRYDPQGSLLGHKDRVTVMLVTIDRRGFLKNLSITDESGVTYLDEEAIRAFKKAAPFLYPPQELFDGKEEFSFTFAFYLQQHRGFSFDFNW